MRLVIKKQTLFMLMVHKDILVYRQIREKTQLLMDDTDSLFSGSRRILKINFLTAHVHFPVGRLLNARDHFHQGGLSGAVFADQNVYLSLEKIEGYAVQGFCTGINFIYFFTVENNIWIVKHNAPPFIRLSFLPA